MDVNYSAALAATLKEEGGYSNNPADPGGATNFGVTQATYSAYLTTRGISDTPVINITQAQVADIYRMYWENVRSPALPSGVDAAAFDLAVNSGWRTAATLLQGALGDVGRPVTVDGSIGPVTLAEAAKADPVALVVAISHARLDFLQRLSTFQTFGSGWTGRTFRIGAMAARLAASPPRP